MENERAIEPKEVTAWKGAPWLFLTIGFLAVAILTFLILRTIATTSTAPVPPSVSASQPGEFTERSAGFSIKYPAGWTRLGEAELAKFKGIFAFGVRRENPDALFSVRIQKVRPDNVKLEQVAEALDVAMANNFADFKKIAEEIVKLSNGKKALKYEYSFTSQQQQGKVREVLTIILDEKKVFHLAAWAKEAEFEGVRGEINNILENFTF